MTICAEPPQSTEILQRQREACRWVTSQGERPRTLIARQNAAYRHLEQSQALVPCHKQELTLQSRQHSMQQSVENGDYIIGYGGGCGIKPREIPAHPIFPAPPQPTPQDGAKHWAELHTAQSPDAKWLTNWISRIPAYGCRCHRDFHLIIAANPPRFDDWFP